MVKIITTADTEDAEDAQRAEYHSILSAPSVNSVTAGVGLATGISSLIIQLNWSKR